MTFINGHVADRPGHRPASPAGRYRTVEIDGESPLTRPKMTPSTRSFLTEPVRGGSSFLAARLVARRHRLAQRILYAFEIDLDVSPTLISEALAGCANP